MNIFLYMYYVLSIVYYVLSIVYCVLCVLCEYDRVYEQIFIKFIYK